MVAAGRLLDRADGDSATMIDDALATLAGSAWETALKAAQAQVMQFDFDAARRLFPVSLTKGQ